MLKLNQQQRCNFADCTIVPEVNEDEIWYFRNQKYKDLMKPYQEFVLFKKYLLVAHSNILSCFDTFRKKWICHQKFEVGKDDEDFEHRSLSYQMRKKVIKVFRYEASDDANFAIGLLFQDGTFEKVFI